MGKFLFFMILSQNERKIIATSRFFAVDLSTQKKKLDKFMEEYLDIFSSPTAVPLHYQFKNPIYLTPVQRYLMGQSTTILC
jgi:hypothetical protein